MATQAWAAPAASVPVRATSSPERLSASAAERRSSATRPKRRASASRSAAFGLDRHPARLAADRVDAYRAAELGRGHGSLPSSKAPKARPSSAAAKRSSRPATNAAASSEGGASWKTLRATASLNAAFSRGAEGREPAAEGAHHPADMLADDIVADADLAERPVHVVDEDLGEQHRGAAPRFALAFHPQQHQGEDRRDHVEAAVERVRHPALAIPGRLAPAGDDGAIERVERRALPGLAENSLDEGQGVGPIVAWACAG